VLRPHSHDSPSTVPAGRGGGSSGRTLQSGGVRPVRR